MGATLALEIGLPERLAAEGEPVREPGRFLLHDPQQAYLVTAGRLELYAVRIRADGETVERAFLLSRGVGELAWGVGTHEAEDGTREGILAVPAPGTELRRARARQLVALAREAVQQEGASLLVDSWIADLSRGVTGELRARSEDLSATRTWRRDPALSILDDFHRALLANLAARRLTERDADRERRESRARADRELTARTLAGLAGVLGAAHARGGRASGPSFPSPLAAALDTVLDALGVALGPVPAGIETERDPVRALARHAGVRARRVALRGRWFTGDHGPLLAFREDGHRPVALLPGPPGRYSLVDGESRTPVTQNVATTLEPFGYAFYRRLPGRPLGIRDLLRFGLFGVERDLATVLAMGAAAGALALVPPLATGLVFDSIIPGASRGQLLQVAAGLFLAAVTSALFGLTRSIAIVRAEGRAGAALQAAVWDRLLDLPAGFFRRFTAGDLALRAYGVDTIHRALSSGVIGSLMSALFGLLNAALLFHYSPRLALVAVGLVSVAVGVTAVSGLRQLARQEPLAALQGRIQGLVLQLIGGIAKLRIAGAEGRAFARWAEAFGEQKRLALATRAPLQVFGAVYPLVASMAIYGMAVAKGGGARPSLSAGNLIGFVAAFQLFLSSTLQLCQSGLSMLGLRPTWDRLRPILETSPEVDRDSADPGVLRGEVEVAHVSFRYAGADSPLVLDDVSLRIRPGEFVAIVGASGSGKSTLLRLLLGFERPTSGTVSYDGQDLLGLDLRAVRRQIGVVLQDGKLFTGDILSNILGASNLSVEDALEAARRAGLERDLERMPMGIRTLVSEGGTTLSGGQRQRLLIARAIVRKPRLLLLDEATSALDNETQAAVSAGIEALEATRVVIAHRLSTIVHADRILVLSKGRLAQSGTYAELLEAPGPFAQLARRQIA